MTVTWQTRIDCEYPGCYLYLTFDHKEAGGVALRARTLASKKDWLWTKEKGDRCPKHKDS